MKFNRLQTEHSMDQHWRKDAGTQRLQTNLDLVNETTSVHRDVLQHEASPSAAHHHVNVFIFIWCFN
ncbi:unnamed protein product [Pleuronectes platessa]|uniref:Uncharacterized protein n=1 Tax=Pleuronectes platessa TaxID=8262 RepID=A0A9N7U9I2_PLEPL|nr:unnamed protein product [Pleuronectes platessa]